MAETGGPGQAVNPGFAAFLEESAEDLYEAAPCGYVSALLDGPIVRVNRTFLSWTGYRAEEVVGVRRLQDLLTPGGRIFYETHYAPLLRLQGQVREIALDFVCADGRTLPVLMNSVLKTDETGAALLSRTTIFDATERRSYEQELLRAKRSAEESEARVRLLAETLQRSLIPPAPPMVPALDVAAVYRPAGLGDQVGGDFYDIFETARGDWAVVLGDVCGKGPEAATVTALARYTVRAAAMEARRPNRVLMRLNDALLRQRAERFCTVVYARLRNLRGRWRITVASGGHPPPIRVTGRGEMGSVGRPGHLLGVLDEAELHDVSIDLDPGDALVFFTDGVTEARRDREFYGDDRLRDLLRALAGRTAADIAAAIESDVVAFQSGIPRDDIAVVVVAAPAQLDPRA